MTCEEFQRVLPENWGGHTVEQKEHLKSCSACSELVSDLNAISDQAGLLQASEEPCPRVWSSIEIALRQEGLIHEPQPLRSLVPALPRWRAAWLMPLAAAFLMAFGVLVFERGTGRPQLAQQPPAPSPAITAGVRLDRGLSVLAEDEQLLKLMAARAPALKAAYESDLRAVDSYIRDAELSARDNPNDEVAQRYLMNAYEQRAMVYQMALDRSLP